MQTACHIPPYLKGSGNFTPCCKNRGMISEKIKPGTGFVCQQICSYDCGFKESIVNHPWFGGGVAVHLRTSSFSLAM